ncbi:MAG: hypothetical protein HYS27_18210 [Deltaproteobacteria bacterium]|nr:hypothetical protein [Deltaproteobacteria bacterium]
MRMPRWVVVGALTALAGPSCDCGGDPNGDGSGFQGDADGDGLTDAVEGRAEERNTDGDEFPDWRDLDSDGDGIADEVEAGGADPADTDGDGTPDYLDTDADGDGVPDAEEPIGDRDGDGIPDALELDGDGDLILDADEGALDRDGDGLLNPLDDDSDGDGIPDAVEAGDDDLATAPRDTDGDRAPDFLDLDSDDDLVADADEDLNGNGVVDLCTTVGTARCESSPLVDDTDGDGTPDVVEHVAGSDPNDAQSNIPEGDFFFILPFEGPAQTGRFTFATSLRKADIFFSMDTTGSFGEEIAELQASLIGTVVPGVEAAIPDVAFGVGRFEDFPLDPFGLAGDLPYQLIQPITEDRAVAEAGVNALGLAAGGLDTPESGIEALYQWASGAGVPAFGMLPFSSGGAGGVGFRADALPVIVQITDARSHSAAEYAPFAAEAHTYDDALAALGAIGAKVIGVDSLENAGNADDPRDELERFAIDSGAVIPPNGAGQCLTGVAGAPVAPVGSVCPLVFDVAPDGGGLGGLIVDGITRLATEGTLDISTRLAGRDADNAGALLPANTTSADFVTGVTPVAPPPAGATIDGGTFRDVTVGAAVMFEVTAQNDFLPGATVDRLFEVEIHVLGGLVTLLDVKRVFVIVPKDIELPPISG